MRKRRGLPNAYVITSATSSRVIIRKNVFCEGNPDISEFNDGCHRRLTLIPLKYKKSPLWLNGE